MLSLTILAILAGAIWLGATKPKDTDDYNDWNDYQ